MSSKLIVTDREELKEILESIILRIEEKKNQGVGEKVFYINQVAKMLGKAHSTVKKLATAGIIRTTKNGLIPESAIKEYLDQNP